MKSEPLDTWKLYLKAARLDGAASVLPAAFRDASYQFHDVAIAGFKEQQPRWQRGVAQTNGAFGEAVGQLYVKQYFPPAYRARMQALVANLLKTYSTSIDGLAWMSPATKKEAHLKLSKYGVKIGYPDTWRDYSAFEVRPGDALGNSDRGDAFEYRRQIVRVGAKVDRTEWGMTPQTINAYYSGNKNEIVFPAAILQPPFFDVAADDAVNYGAIGAVIGHEISHGFDDKGSQLDGDGRLRNWWTDDDRKAFENVTNRLVAQYEAYAPIPGQHLNGKLTLGENIADLSGLQISYKAWKLSLGGKPSPDARRPHGRPALHLRLRPGVALEDARRTLAATADDRPALAGPVPRGRRDDQRRCVPRGLPHPAGRQDVEGAGGPAAPVVSTMRG